jgi:hypothetical protein
LELVPQPLAPQAAATEAPRLFQLLLLRVAAAVESRFPQPVDRVAVAVKAITVQMELPGKDTKAAITAVMVAAVAVEPGHLAQMELGITVALEVRELRL